MEAFIEGLNDNELALKVRNLTPVNLQAAYQTAIMLEANQAIVNRNEDSKERRREGRGDIQARAVTKEDSDSHLRDRVRMLEEKLTCRTLATPTEEQTEERERISEV